MGEGLGAVFPAAANQSNTGAEGSVTFWTLVSFLNRCQGDHFEFAQLTLLLMSPCYPVVLEKGSAFVDFATPGRSV